MLKWFTVQLTKNRKFRNRTKFYRLPSHSLFEIKRKWVNKKDETIPFIIFHEVHVFIFTIRRPHEKKNRILKTNEAPATIRPLPECITSNENVKKKYYAFSILAVARSYYQHKQIEFGIFSHSSSPLLGFFLFEIIIKIVRFNSVSMLANMATVNWKHKKNRSKREKDEGKKKFVTMKPRIYVTVFCLNGFHGNWLRFLLSFSCFFAFDTVSKYLLFIKRKIERKSSRSNERNRKSTKKFRIRLFSSRIKSAWPKMCLATIKAIALWNFRTLASNWKRQHLSMNDVHNWF